MLARIGYYRIVLRNPSSFKKIDDLVFVSTRLLGFGQLVPLELQDLELISTIGGEDGG